MIKHWQLIGLISLLTLGCKSSSNDTSVANLSTSSKERIAETPTPIFKHDRDKVDSLLIVGSLRVLSSDEYEGRKTGTAGNQKAQAYILNEFNKLKLLPLGNSFEQSFSCNVDKKIIKGKNLIAYIKGRQFPEQFIGISAHYDHEGIKKGKIYNGADDNASGIGGLLGLAAYFSKNPPMHSILLMAFDAEESDLQGSKYFVDHSLVKLHQIKCLINMDMISRNPEAEIYASGTAHFPFLKPMLEKVNQENPNIFLLFGHDKVRRSRNDLQDWTHSSDHYPFYEQGIPYIYFGVEDHPDYHKPSDIFEKINLEFYLDVVDFVIDTTEELDIGLPKVIEK